MDLCRRVIRQQITKERIEQGKIDELNLPKSIKDYLAYKDRVKATVNGSASPAAGDAEGATSASNLNDDEDMDDDLSEERRWGSANATRAAPKPATSVAASSN